MKKYHDNFSYISCEIITFISIIFVCFPEISPAVREAYSCFRVLSLCKRVNLEEKKYGTTPAKTSSLLDGESCRWIVSSHAPSSSSSVVTDRCYYYLENFAVYYYDGRSLFTWSWRDTNRISVDSYRLCKSSSIVSRYRTTIAIRELSIIQTLECHW